MSISANPAGENATGYEPADVRPVIPTGSNGNMGLWAFLAVLGAGGGVLFSALNASREAVQTPSVLQPGAGDPVRISSPPPLAIPEQFANNPRGDLRPAIVPDPGQPAGRQIVPSAPQFRPKTPAPFSPAPILASDPLPPVQLQPPRVVFDNRTAPTATPLPAARGEDGSARVTAERFLNPSLTIPQGTVIPAVLETALDSTRAGGVRALVQRDVSGFDGSRRYHRPRLPVV